MKPVLHERPKKGAPYPTEFREEAVRYWLSSGKRVGEVALELGVSDSSLQHWRDHMEGNKPVSGSSTASSAIADADALELAREVGRLRKELEAMTRQRDILKRLSASSPARTPTEVPGDQVIQSIVSTSASASVSASGGYSVREVCTALETSPSGYYAHWHKAARPRRQEDERITLVMREVYECGRGAYGSPRLVRGLRARGIRCGKARVRRLMREHGLCALQKKRFRVQTTKSSPYLPVAPNLLPEAPEPNAPGQLFCSDITYIPTEEGWLYMGVTLDGYSRRCAGWTARDNMETPLVADAAKMAFASATSATSSTSCIDQPIHHSDRGSQYASEAFRCLLEEETIQQSMSRKGNCYDNALVESFFATLKTECFNNFQLPLRYSAYPATS